MEQENGGQKFQHHKWCFQRHSNVDVPPLDMVDDIVTASKCGTTTIALKNCASLHIGKKSKNHECHKVEVHNEEITKF